MFTFACSLWCSVPLMIYTSPFLRLTSAPVCSLISRRVAPPFPIIIPLYSTGISTSSQIPLFTSSCQENGYSHFFKMLGEKSLEWRPGIYTKMKTFIFTTYHFFQNNPLCTCYLLCIATDRKSFLLWVCWPNLCPRSLSYVLYHISSPTDDMSFKIFGNWHKFTLHCLCGCLLNVALP